MKINIDENKLNERIKRLTQKLEKEYRKQLVYADNKLKQEFVKLYEQIIDQYYTYETHYYYRHGVGKGTRTGENLYRASDMHMAIGGGKFNDNFVFEINDKDELFEGYKYTTADQVFENVMSGWRLEVGGVNTFVANVEFLGVYFSGTPNEILGQIYAENIVEKYRYKLFIEAVNRIA